MARFKKGISYALAALILTAVVLVGFSYYTLRRLISRRVTKQDYHAHAHEVFTKHNAESVRFKNSDGHMLSGRLVTRKNARGTVIFCHGYRYTHHSMTVVSHFFDQYNQLYFDFRAFGESEGDYSSVGHHEHRDVIAACRFIKEKGLTQPIILFGTSMGAVAIIKAVRRQPDIADILILDSPYAHFPEEMAHSFSYFVGLPYYPFMPLFLWLFRLFVGHEPLNEHPEDDIEHIDKPLFIMHSSGDTITLPDHSVRLYRKVGKVNKRSRLWVGPPTYHCKMFKYYPELYAHKIGRFLSKANAWLRADAKGLS